VPFSVEQHQIFDVQEFIPPYFSSVVLAYLIFKIDC